MDEQTKSILQGIIGAAQQLTGVVKNLNEEVMKLQREVYALKYPEETK
jgi:hypothetical protein